MRFIKILFAITFIFQQSVFSQVWLKKIAAYQMTVEEVEKLISAVPDKSLSTKDSYIYLLKEGRLEIDFSLGRCVEGMYGKWELEKGVIIQAVFYPEKWRKISYYEKDVKSLEKEQGRGYVFSYYKNNTKGIRYTMQWEKVYSITMSAAENINPVKCKD